MMVYSSVTRFDCTDSEIAQAMLQPYLVSDFQAAFIDSSNFVKNAINVGSVKVLYK